MGEPMSDSAQIHVKPAVDSFPGEYQPSSSVCARTRPRRKSAINITKNTPKKSKIQEESREEVEGIRTQYKSLLVVLKEVKKAFADLKARFDNNKDSYDNLIKDMSDSLEKKDEELRQCRLEAKLAKERIEQLEKDASAGLHTQITPAVEIQADKTENKSMQEVSDHISAFVTPNVRGRLGRQSLAGGCNASFNTTVAEMSENHVSFKKIAIHQKEMLDCYALLSGISLVYDADAASPDVSRQTADMFNCSIQCGNPFDGLRFRLSIDYECDQFSYVPCPDSFPATDGKTEEGTATVALPDFMRETIYFKSNKAPYLLSRILSALPEQSTANGQKSQH